MQTLPSSLQSPPSAAVQFQIDVLLLETGWAAYHGANCLRWVIAACNSADGYLSEFRLDLALQHLKSAVACGRRALDEKWRLAAMLSTNTPGPKGGETSGPGARLPASVWLLDTRSPGGEWELDHGAGHYDSEAEAVAAADNLMSLSKHGREYQPVEYRR